SMWPNGSAAEAPNLMVPDGSDITTDTLALCPCREDWFTVTVPANRKVMVSVGYVGSDAGADLRTSLYKSADATWGSGTPVALGSTSSMLMYTASDADTYYVKVYSATHRTQPGYYLNVGVYYN